MNLSISWRDVASSWGDTGKILAAAVVGVAASMATDYFMKKAANYFHIPNIENTNLVQGTLETRARNRLIMDVSAAAMGLIAPIPLPMEFKPFNLSQNVQLVMLDLLVYGAAKAAFRGNAFVESKGFRILMLNRMITGAAFAKMGSYSKLLVPGFLVALHFAFKNDDRERWLGYDNAGDTLSGRFVREADSALDWIREPVTAAPLGGPLLEA